MASNKPKNPQVGVIECRYHTVPVQAKVMRSLAKNKFYISCGECGLIMPTLPHFQEYIKANAKFNQDINGGIIKPVPVAGATDTSQAEQQQAEPEKQSQKAAAPAAKAEPEAKPQKVASNFDQEMGF